MAATTSSASAWGKPCSWALDSEEHEAELSQQEVTVEETSDFPSLSAAAVTKKKKPPQTKTVSLFEFNTPKTLNLPTGPRERSAEEIERSSSRLGGGGGGGDDSSSRWGRDRGGGGDPSRRREPPPPSKADEVDDWAAAKKSLPHGGAGAGFFDSPSSRADDSDSWISKKSFIPSSDTTRMMRRGVGFDNGGGGGRADSDDTWGTKREAQDAHNNQNGGRPRLVLQPRSLPVTNVQQQPQPDLTPKTNPFGAARPREQVLAEKGQYLKKIDDKLESFKIKENGNGNRMASEDPPTNSWRKTAFDHSPTPSEEKEYIADENLAEN